MQEVFLDDGGPTFKIGHRRQRNETKSRQLRQTSKFLYCHRFMHVPSSHFKGSGNLLSKHRMAYSKCETPKTPNCDNVRAVTCVSVRGASVLPPAHCAGKGAVIFFVSVKDLSAESLLKQGDVFQLPELACCLHFLQRVSVIPYVLKQGLPREIVSLIRVSQLHKENILATLPVIPMEYGSNRLNHHVVDHLPQ